MSTKKLYYLFSFLLTIGWLLNEKHGKIHAQTLTTSTALDSLHQILTMQKDKPEKVNTLNDLSREYYRRGSYDTAFTFVSKAY